jgi:hypothetical protein
MAEEDIAYLLSRGKLAEPFETEQSEINRLVDKSKVKDFIDQQKKKSTVNCTKRDLNIVYKWLVSKNELRSIETIHATELDAYLAEFYVNVKKDNGSEYEPGSIDSIRASVERHLRESEYPPSLRDKVFYFSTRALSAKQIQLNNLEKDKNQKQRKQ